MPSTDTTKAICIIGAGASGLAMAKNLRDFAIPFDCLEREGDIGGLWNASTNAGVVYDTTHLVSYSRFTGFEDYPMQGDAYPVYPNHAQALGYLKSYAQHYRLGDRIELNTKVANVTERADGMWDVQVEGEGKPRVYRGVVVANGHHDVPRLPSIPGTFSGEIIHSRNYKSPTQLIGKRVLVVGAGNSGCDIVRDASHVASRVLLSIRRGYWFMPKFVFGYPTQQVANLFQSIPMPRRVRRFLYESANWLLVGPAHRYGLPKPHYHFDESHPTMSDEIPRLIAHGRLSVKPKIVRYEGKRVVFGDGSSEAIDTIVFATGYKAVFPFFKEQPFLGTDGHTLMQLSAFHPSKPMLFAAGLSQANGSMWRVADWQAQLIARYIAARDQAPGTARWIRDRIAALTAPRRQRWFVPSPRHALEVNYYDYERMMKRFIRDVDRRLPRPTPPAPVVTTGGAPAAAGT
jgi:cation diffusion facilitator CzcD-associated flavoprotein CzcO